MNLAQRLFAKAMTCFEPRPVEEQQEGLLAPEEWSAPCYSQKINSDKLKKRLPRETRIHIAQELHDLVMNQVFQLDEFNENYADEYAWMYANMLDMLGVFPQEVQFIDDNFHHLFDIFWETVIRAKTAVDSRTFGMRGMKKSRKRSRKYRSR